ncbi:hypothetical protein JTB14_017418 [Gonioctena quinquepunctata]|nr:hypothetical protein JTB14_017418 [Gonioctena quinquepunctata]
MQKDKDFTFSSLRQLERSKEKADLLAHMFSSNSALEAVGKQLPTIPRISSSMPEVAFRSHTIKRILRNLDWTRWNSDNCPEELCSRAL